MEFESDWKSHLRSICEHADSMSLVCCSLVNNHLRSFYPPQWSKSGVVRWLSDYIAATGIRLEVESVRSRLETSFHASYYLHGDSNALQIITEHTPRHGFKAWKQKTWRLESNYFTTESEKPLWVSPFFSAFVYIGSYCLQYYLNVPLCFS